MRTNRPFRLMLEGVLVLIAAGAFLGCSLDGAWDTIARQLDENQNPSDPWVDPSWTRRMRLEFSQAQVSENLVDFPLLVVLDSTRVDYGTFTNLDALRFYDAGASPGELYYEIEKWDPAGKSYIWVKVPQIDANSGSDNIWMYWDNASAGPTVYRNAAQVWADYELVYHLGETGTSFTDSSGNGHTGTAVVAATPEQAMIGGGFRSDSAPVNWINSGWTLTAPNYNNYTVEVWVKGDSAPIVTSYTNGPLMAHYPFSLGWDHTSATYAGKLQYNDGGWSAVDLGALLGGQWYYLAVTAASAVLEISTYRNGMLTVVDSANYDGTFGNPTYTLRIGDDNVLTHPMDGLIDEARVSTTVHSAAWIQAQYLSMTDAFVDYRPAEQL